MKRIFILLIAVSTLVSCKKTYVCECVTTKPNMTGAWVDIIETRQRNLQDAQEWCETGNYETLNQTQICTIK